MGKMITKAILVMVWKIDYFNMCYFVVYLLYKIKNRAMYVYWQLEDCALQIYRYHNGTQGDYGTYLDLESTIDEQQEELEGFQDQ